MKWLGEYLYVSPAQEHFWSISSSAVHSHAIASTCCIPIRQASGIYFLVCLFLMCCSNSIAWYRNPTGQAVLPDIVHELVDPVHVVRLHGGIELDPHAIIETIVGVMLIVSVLVIFSQPARWLIFRRGVIVYSTLALFRAVTVLVTTLPDARPLCHQHTTGPFPMKDIGMCCCMPG